MTGETETADGGSVDTLTADAQAELQQSMPVVDDDTETEPVENKTDAGESEVAQESGRSMKRGLAAALIAAAVLFVGGAGFAAAAVQPYLADRATVAIKERVAATAAEALTTLWTYTPEDVDALPDRASRYLAGELAEQFRGLMGSVVPESKQAQVTKRTVVVGTAVESLSRDEATVVVYTNTTNSSPLTKDIPSLSFWSYRVTMQRDGGDWLISSMNTVTTLDLTPQL